MIENLQKNNLLYKTMNTEKQIHYIRPKYWWKIEKIQLWELFESYKKTWIKQIIRFNQNIYDVLNKRFDNWNNINLFNNKKLWKLFE